MPDRPPPCWFRKLQDGRMEIMLRVGDVKLRASGPEPKMFELVEWFENWTGKRVDSPLWKRPLRTGPRPIAGQVELDDVGEPLAMPELSSHATVPDEL